jgi:uncharacterized protein YqhQ
MHNQRFPYGGQAVIEGVMIRGKNCAFLAVRRPDGGIYTSPLNLSKWYNGVMRRVPLIRGGVVLVETLLLGIRALNRSAEIAMTHDESSGEDGSTVPSKSDRLILGVTQAVGLTIGVGVFFLLPLFAARSLDWAIPSALLSNLVEGLIRLAMLVGYIWGVGRLQDVKRVFAYHGAEHMAVHAYEADDVLTPEHLTRYSTAHPRCGTAFLLVVVVVAVIVFAFVGRPSLWLSALLRVVLIPIVAGLAYEIIRGAGKHSDHPLAKMISFPGLALQRLTTRQPDLSQLEVAISAIEGAIATDAISNLEESGQGDLAIGPDKT